MAHVEQEDRRIALRSHLWRVQAQLENERSSFLASWRDLGDYILPRRPRFTVTDTNRGERRNLKIYDNTSTLAARTLRAGMVGGITPPSRPWFRLTFSEPSLAELEQVKLWLDVVTRRMQTVFLRSNLYKVLPILYGDLGVFATAAMFLEEDFTGKVIHATPIPIGSYSIANDGKGLVRVFFREFRMTVRQIDDNFGIENATDHTQDLWRQDLKETWVDVCHLIEPNPEVDPERLQAKFKPFRSIYYEKGTGSQQQNSHIGGILRESGFDMFPVLAPRWELTGEDSYGTSCPGMESIGDIKQLQIGERRIMQAIEKVGNPAMTGPAAMKKMRASVIPGDVTYLDVREGEKGFRPVYQIDPRIDHWNQKQEQVRQRIRRAFYEDLFLLLTADPRQQPPTAREVDERHEEKLNALGPVLEQLNQDLLDQLIDYAFEMMRRQGLIPDPPPEIEGLPVKVEYVSIMAQAQKLIGIANIDRFVGYVTQLATVDASAIDKLDIDQSIDEYGDRTGVPVQLIRSDDEVAEIREAKAKAQQAAAQMEAIRTGAETAKDLAAAGLEDDSALKRLIGRANGGGVPTAR